MEVNQQLKRQIIIKIGILFFLLFAVLYGIFALESDNSVFSQDGMIIVYDTTTFKAIKSSSDGEALSNDGIKYTITNNNETPSKYKLVLKVNEDKELLKYIRVGIDDLYIDNLTNFNKNKDGYEIMEYELDSGYTKIHLIKLWYKLDIDSSIALDEIDYELKLVKQDK